ncbi:alpha/beta hydrolase [Aeromicrobium sp.]|nr:alpha/beta hydrolase [Candidatus Saccharibacteria bacterium]
MRNAIIVHGTCDSHEYFSQDFPSASNNHWLPWLQKQLIINDIKADTPEMPHSYKPDYEVWKREVERFDIGPETMLVGHSCGGGFWVRYLSEHPNVRVGKVVLVAPWLDPSNTKKTDFFDFEFDPDLVSRTAGLTIFNSSNDHEGIQWSAQIICNVLNHWTFKSFENYGHFCLNDMRTTEFPELLQELIAVNIT